MMNKTAGPRPNPFAVASGTAVRFALLIIAASTAVFLYAHILAPTALEGPSTADPAFDACFRKHFDNATHRGGNANPFAISTYINPSSVDMDCGLPSGRSQWLNFTTLALFWLIVLLLYWWMPAWRLRRRSLRSLPLDKFPDLAAYLAKLRQTAGVTEQMNFVVNYLDPSASGLAFGRLGRRYIVLSRGMLALFDRDRPAFRAIVLHELAHLRNRDVDIAFITVAVWRVYLVVILLPLVIYIPYELATGGTQGYILAFAVTLVWYLAFLAVLVLLTRNAVLRSRELHADARAALWDETSDGLARLFGQQRRQQSGWLSRLLAVHPGSSDRLTALTDTRSMLVMGFGEALTMGLAISLALDLRTTMGLIGSTIAQTFWAILLALGVGFGMWRGAISEYVTRGPVKADMAGLGLGIGLVGGIVSPMQILSFDVLGGPVVNTVVGIILPWCALLVVSSWLFVRWMATVTRAWLPVATTGKHPVIIVMASLAISAVLLIVWLNFVLDLAPAAAVVQSETLSGWPQMVAFFATAVIVIIAVPPVLSVTILLGIAGYPLAGVVLARRLRAVPQVSWLTLDPLPAEWCTQTQPTPRFAVTKVAIMTALSALAFILICYLIGLLSAPAILTAAIEAHLTHLFAWATQVLAAIIATTRVRDLRVLYGIIAAFIAGIVIVVGQEVVFRLTLCTFSLIHDKPCELVVSPLSPTLRVMSLDLTFGLELAFLAALLTAAVTRRRPAHVVQPILGTAGDQGETTTGTGDRWPASTPEIAVQDGGHDVTPGT
jgi:Zn-dependent protease with chaperone function